MYLEVDKEHYTVKGQKIVPDLGFKVQGQILQSSLILAIAS